MDYLHRAVQAGFWMQYLPHLVVGHPQTLTAGAADEQGRRKRYNYGYGEGAIARKYSVPLWYAGGIVVCPMLRAIADALRGKREEASGEWLTFRGRLDGWLRTARG
jgi:hypothetical protein